MAHPFRFLSFGAVLVCALGFAACPSRAESDPVTIAQTPDVVTLANGVVTLTVARQNANILSLRLRGMELLSHGQAYWNIMGATPGQPNSQLKGLPSELIITQDPATNGGAMGEFALRFPYLGQPGVEPLDIEIRYALKRGDNGVYGWTIAEHQPSFPAFNIEVNTVCLKLSPDIFDFLSIDSRRQRHMATSQDWVNGTQLNLWEARRLNTGIRQGLVEHKYDYTFRFAETPAWGWSSTTKHVGVFIVNPSLEYLNGGATEMDYGGHIDVKPRLPADPTLLFIWHSPHYGGRGVPIAAGEAWRKVMGPFLIYLPSGSTPDAMWHDALARAEVEKAQWPYAWANAPGYPHEAERGAVSGTLTVRDPQDPAANAGGAWVGLAAAPFDGNFKKSGPIRIDWQSDGKHYEYWTQADSQGRFTIRHARPGTYHLYAFNNGVLDAYDKADVQVAASHNTDLGDLTWVPVRYGQQLWQIGIADRSAEEFRHGDHYWQWGLYNLYPTEFPRDVDFIVGQSDWRKDWNYAQPPRPDGHGGWTNTTWHIRFNRESALSGTATLTLAICGFRGGPVDVSLNGRPIGSTGPVPESGVMHRDGIRSQSLIERNIVFDASLIHAGENIIALTKEAHAWPDGVLYDCVRLAADTSRPYSP
jgi:rhamnogalacturonan endolyase